MTNNASVQMEDSEAGSVFGRVTYSGPTSFRVNWEQTDADDTVAWYEQGDARVTLAPVYCSREYCLNERLPGDLDADGVCDDCNRPTHDDGPEWEAEMAFDGLL